MNNCLITNIVLSLLTGLIAGFFVDWMIKERSKLRWLRVKKQLVRYLDETLDGILSSIRIGIDLNLPSELTSLEEKDFAKNFIGYFDRNVLGIFEQYQDKIKYMSMEKEQELSHNLLQGYNSLTILANFFGIFGEASDPWYIESIFKLIDRISLVRVPYTVLPELGRPHQDKNDEKLMGMRTTFFNFIHELLSFALQVKKNKLIRDLLDTKE